MITNNTHPSVPPPPGATVDKWRDYDGVPLRGFDGTRRGEHVPIRVVGFQHADGHVASSCAYIECPEVEFDSAALRGLAADALSAADELDALSN
ncbi:MAG: hypothetical protein WAN71_18495 [Mycobacterium sp.]|uniref:hypothetical protein n=1 Tax=Mycobacterium sp. TaxID=1785 RepID=UPI003BB0B60E